MQVKNEEKNNCKILVRFTNKHFYQLNDMTALIF